jgi:long-chain acyl-CoA synthetase
MSEPLIPEHIHSLADFVEQRLKKYGDKPAFHCLGQTLSFTEIEEKSRFLACWLQHKAGLEPGDRLAIQLPNLLQYPIAVYAALRAGLILVNTNPLYTPREMEHQFKDAGAKAIIILDGLLPKLRDIISETDIETTIVTSAAELPSDTPCDAPDGCISWSQAMAEGRDMKLRPRPESSLEDICMLQYTGGTTGVAKGAALTQGNILSNAAQTGERLGASCLEGQESVVCPLPVYHIYAFTVNLVYFFSTGNLNILIPNPRDLEAFVSALKPFQFSAFAGINTLFVGLCQHPGFRGLDFSRLKLTYSGGAPLTSNAVTVWQQVTSCSISEGYGLSETSPVLCLNEPGNEKLGTVGPPVVQTDIQMLDEQDQPVPDGQEGQIAAKGPQIMSGYWQRPEETANVMTETGYFKTGDVGIRMPDGCIKIVDRIKDLILVSGFNVYPNEVEDVLTSHPDIVEAAVIGEPDERSGERVCAYITVSQPIQEAAVVNYCREQLAGYKVPKKVIVMKELPKSTVGKILRRELRK